MCDGEKKNLTMGEFIERCNEKREATKENHYKTLAMVFGRSDYWVDAKIESKLAVYITYIVQLNCVGNDMARSAIEYISPSALSITGGKPDVFYKIEPLTDNKFEIRFCRKEIDGTTDFLFQELIKDLCKQANVNYSDLFDSSDINEEDESVYLADNVEE